MLKKIFKDLLSVLLISFISFALISCEGIFNNINFSEESSEKDFITKNGKILVKGNVDLQGAVPENMAKTAMPDFSSITYVITATPSEGEAVKATALSDGSFSLELYPGSYSVKVEGYKTADTEKKTILKGKYINAATEDLLSVTGDGVTGLSLSVSPVISAAPGENLYGTVNLSIGLTDSIIKSWKATWSEDGAAVEKKQSSSSAVSSINFNLVADGQTEADKKVGSYYVTFELFSEENYVSPVLVFSEMINVFENATTSMWVSHGASDFINADGTMTIAKTQLENRINYYVNQTTGNSSNPGSYFQPLDNIQDAVDRIIASNDGSKNYTIYICEDYKITEVPPAANNSAIACIRNNSSKELNLTFKSFGNTPTTKKIDCNVLNARGIFVKGTDASSKVVLTVSNLNLCNANTTLGGAIYASDNTTINLTEGTLISNNTVNQGGGGIFLASGTDSTNCVLNIDGANFTGNKAVASPEAVDIFGCGGAIYCYSGTVNLISGIIGGESSDLANTAVVGGGICIQDGKVTQSGGKIQGNDANNGGGIELKGTAAVFNLKAGEISRNVAHGGGGAIGFLFGTVTISGGSIESNTDEYGFGKGIYFQNAGIGFSNPVLILKDDAYIKSDNEILVTDVPVTLASNLSNDQVAVIRVASDNPDTRVLLNYDSTDYVKTNYNKFSYFEDYLLIDNKGYTRDPDAQPSIASLKPAGVTLPSSSFTLPDSPKELTLSTAAELKQLSLWSKSSKLIGYSFTMTDDIDLESADDFVPIGSHNNAGEVFEGIFDGNGFEIKNLYVNTPSASNSGLFGKCQDALIKNLTVSGEVTAKDYVGGIVGSIYIYQSPAENYGIQNCVSYVNVSGTNSAGGVVGHVLDCKVSKCVNFGTVTSVRSAGISATSLKGNFSECVNFGTIKGIANSTGEDAAGIIGKITEGGNSNISSCYNAGTIIKPADSQATGTDLNYAFLVGKGTTALTSSYNYYLNSSLQFKGAAGLTDSESTFCRTNYDFFKNNLSTNAPFDSWTETVTYNGQSYIVPVECKYNHTSYVDISGYSALPADVRDLAIKSDSDLRKLSAWAETSTLSGYNFYVTENITMGAESLTPIGISSSKYFSGTFNGLGNVISNLNISRSATTSNNGLFGYIKKGAIENVVITGTIEGGQYTGSVAGYVGDSSSSIRNCVSYADVTCNATNSNYSGGICGENKGIVENCVYFGTLSGINSYVGGITGCIENGGSVKRCVNFGTVKALNNSSSTYYGGIIGQIFTSGSVSDCYNAGEVISSASAHGLISGYASQGTYSNNYYITDSTTMTGIGNNGADIEGQIKKETLSVVKNSTNPFRTWTETVTFNGESYPVPVRCPIAPANMSMIPLASCASDPGPGTYSISSIDDLNKLNDWNAADGYAGYTFVLLSDVAMDVFHPIGSESNPFNGTFDGSGNKITDLRITENSGNNVGLFSVVGTGAKICNLTVEGTIKGNDSVGGICGQNNGILSNCMFTGTVEGTKEVGGICGKSNYGGEVENCVNLGNISAIDSIAAGIVGTNGSNISDCANFGNISAPEGVGGICATSNSGEIRSCLATGSVTKTNDAVYTLGMIAGVSSSVITNCYYVSDTIDSGCGDNSQNVSTATGLKPDTSGEFECITPDSYSLSDLKSKLGVVWTKTITLAGKVYPSPM